MGHRTVLYARHAAAGAKLVDFGGWDMPLHYGSQIDEHHAVRSDAGLFDVSHMTVVQLEGPGARDFLRHALANDVARIDGVAKGLYSCMLNEAGGVIDDLIAYRRGDNRYTIIVNAATHDKDLAWLHRQLDGFDAALTETIDKVMLAVQGPQACARVAALLPSALSESALALPTFGCVAADDLFVARTGYTGEDGFEIVAAPDAGIELWDRCMAAGIRPCGLGARDTLRMEAGLNLYGQDMDEATSPLAAGLGWTVAWEPADRDFIGRAALTAERDAGPAERFVGLVLEERGIMRHGQRVITDAGDGLVTSGGFSPTLQQSIALARVPVGAGEACRVQIRRDERRARIVRPAFVRRGKSLLES